MKSFKEKYNIICQKENARFLADDELEKLKKIMLDCYLDVAKVCKEYKIDILLGYGSALGAVRHHGYIPWDDDFDTLMTRKDFEKFKLIFDKELGDKYELNAPNYSNNPSNRFPKILVKGTRFVEVGVNPNAEYAKIKIDIFILENVPKNKVIRYIKGMFCNLIMAICGSVGNFEENNKIFKIKTFIGKIFSFKSYAYWCNKVDKLCQYKKETGIVGITTGRKHYFGEIFDICTFFPTKKVMFENLEVNIPGNDDIYLSNLYGNYMQLPPENKRERHYITDIEFKL